MALDPVTAIVDLFNGVGSKVIERIWPDPVQAEAAKIKLAEMAQSGELAKLASETDALKAFLADTASARERESVIVASTAAPLLNKLVTPILALGIVTLTFTMFGVLAFITDGDVNQGQKEVIIYILGALTALATQVCSYYFGSSRGDAAKDQHIADIMKKM
jgi:uncharacterized membrane protein YvlD (DUF360 family)